MKRYHSDYEVEDRKRVAVFFGGCSSEYEISLQSAYGVLSHLGSESRLAKRFEIIPVGITRDGLWLRYYGHVEDLLSGLKHDTWYHDPSCVPVILSPVRKGTDGSRKASCMESGQQADGLKTCQNDDQRSGLMTFFPDGSYDVTPLDMALPVLHGKNGEDGRLQGLIELAGIRLIGCGTMSSALCLDKHRAHLVAEAAGVSVPKAVTISAADVKAGQCILSDAAILRFLTEGLTYPLFVKPVKEGSSHGITKVMEPEMLAPAVAEALCFDDEIIIEESIDGFEVGCALLDDGNGGLIAGRVDEIELLNDGFFDFTKKYGEVDSKIHTPARIDTVTEALIVETARTIYRVLGCSGFARIDMFLTPAGEIFFNEVNTIPGLTSHSRFPKMLSSAGIGFEEMLEILLEGRLA